MRRFSHRAHNYSRCSSRSELGNMLPLTVAVIATVLIALLFFCFKVTRIMGGYAEQRTAIEAAALAAAKDLSMVTIRDPNFGWIGLSDSPPTGKSTVAGDGYALPVVGINSLLATVRLDLYLADSLNDPVMMQRAAEDYNNVSLARTSLVSALRAAAAGGTFKDRNGQTVSPLQDAIAAYNSNIIRMTGSSTNFLVPNSMKLTLGCLSDTTGGGNSGTITNVSSAPIPLPAGTASVQSNQQSGGFYNAFVDIPYASKGSAGDTHFSFAGSTGSVTLVDVLAFTTSNPALTDQTLLIPSVVKCQADQQFIDRDQNGKSLDRVIHIAAAAECVCTFNTIPHPGALTFSFPNGIPPEITSPLFLFSDSQHILNWSPIDEFEMAPVTGDYPENTMTKNVSLPYWNSPHPRLTKALSLALYDWIRKSGPTVNAENLVNWLNSSAFAATTNSVIYAFECTPSTSQGIPTSTITTSIYPCAPVLSRRVSSAQWVAIAGGAMLSSTGNYYDLIVKDNVYNTGPISGGLHAGQPLGNQLPPSANPSGGGTGGVPSPLLSMDEQTPTGGEYPYANGSGVPPTYTTAGQAVDIRFRLTGYPNTVPCGPAPYPTAPVPLPSP